MPTIVTPVIARNDRSPMLLVILAFLGFIAIGMPGAGLIPALTGIVAQRTSISLEAVSIFWLGLCVAVVDYYELSQRLRVKSG
jgi:hypothetical protein